MPVFTPIPVFAPGFVSGPHVPPVSVIGGGVRMPEVEIAERPIKRASSKAGENAFLPKAEQPAPVVPHYPVKQARN